LIDLRLTLLVVLLLATAFFTYVVFGGFISGAGYQPVPGKNLEIMIEFSRPDETKRVFDLGSGFGKIIIRVSSRFHARCTGVEVDPLKVWWTRREIRRRGLQEYADVVKANLLEVDLSSADIVYVFLWEGIMQKLRSKVLREMKPSSVVVSYYHKFDDWEPEAEDTPNKVYMYRIHPLREGTV
jgi:ribosomal protein L11 methylase PrmA